MKRKGGEKQYTNRRHHRWKFAFKRIRRTQLSALRKDIILKNLYRSEEYISVKRPVDHNSKEPKQALAYPPYITPESASF
ncbi:MAG: hypothetical protein D3903_08205 [Candidatus Electrothrix sp. GM3_4]|nr:hypothetical protein [Candidatus Electrothrix sp. GM3_4]